MIVCAAGSAAASSKKARPVVLSTEPIGEAVGVPVETTVIVNFSLPMKCRSINRRTFQLDAVGRVHIAARSVTCNGDSATFTPSGALAINTRYRDEIHWNGEGPQRHHAEERLHVGLHHWSEHQASSHRDGNGNGHLYQYSHRNDDQHCDPYVHGICHCNCHRNRDRHIDCYH